MAAESEERTLAEELKARGLRELSRRDAEGSFLELTYRQVHSLKREELDAVLDIIEKHLRRNRRLLWLMGLSVPPATAAEIYVFSSPADPSFWGLLWTFGFPALMAMCFMGFAIAYGLPRLAALERSRAMLELYQEWGSEAARGTVPTDPI